MPAPFKDHPSDTQVLNENTVPFSKCETRLIPRGRDWIEITDVPILTGDACGTSIRMKPRKSSHRVGS